MDGSSQWGWDVGFQRQLVNVSNVSNQLAFFATSRFDMVWYALIWFNASTCFFNETELILMYFVEIKAYHASKWAMPAATNLSRSQLWFIHGLAIHCSTMKEQTMTPAWHTPQFLPWPSKQIADHMALRTFMCSVWQNAEPRPSTSTWWTSSEWPKTTKLGYSYNANNQNIRCVYIYISL